jgi:phage FluMu protein Com
MRSFRCADQLKCVPSICSCTEDLLLGQNALKAIDKNLKGDAKWNAVAAAMARHSSSLNPATSTECKAYFSLVKQHIKLKKKREARVAASVEQDAQRNTQENSATPTQQLPPRSTTAALRVSLQGLELQGLAVLQAARMHLQVSCKRCKTTAEATLSEEAPWTASCSKCCADIDLTLKTELCNAVSIFLGCEVELSEGNSCLALLKSIALLATISTVFCVCV